MSSAKGFGGRLAAVVVVCALAAVGAAASAAVASTGEVIPLPSGGAGCSRAVVKTGHRAMTITFSLRCSGPRRGRTVGFAIWRYPGRASGIVAYGAPVRVTGAGARSGRARCSLNRGTLGCHTSIDGPVRIAGRLRVRPASRCTEGVSLVQVISPPCHERTCGGAPRLTQLSRGKPRGCGL
jgi:hypothetical protein